MPGGPDSGNIKGNGYTEDESALVTRLVDILIERTLVGDGLRDLPEKFMAAAADPDAAYRAFLADNDRRTEALKQRMTPDQYAAALTLYRVWFSDYLRR